MFALSPFQLIVYHVLSRPLHLKCLCICVCVHLNMCFRTSCWEKTGGLLFSSCTVTTTVQELFRPARDIIIPSVSDSGSVHHTNKVCRRNRRKYLIFTPRYMSHVDHIICKHQKLAEVRPLDGNKATDSLAHKVNMSCYFLAQ